MSEFDNLLNQLEADTTLILVPVGKGVSSCTIPEKVEEPASYHTDTSKNTKEEPISCAEATITTASGGSGKRKSAKRDGMIVIDEIDPSFPMELINQQEDFIFSLHDKQAASSSNEVVHLNKWETYSSRVYSLIMKLARKSRIILKQQGDKKTLTGYHIYALKKRIKEILQQVVAEHGTTTRFFSLESGSGENDLINVEDILCSRCGGEDAPGNDILLCDMQGCCRAYHQNCLDPPVDPEAVKDDPYWFCWVCDTLNNCIGWLNSKLGSSFNNLDEIFPEVGRDVQLWEGRYPANFYDPEVAAPVPVKDEAKKSKKKSDREDSDSESEGRPFML
jgi:hypothetical protein